MHPAENLPEYGSGIGVASGAATAIKQRAAKTKHHVDAGFWQGKKGDQVIFVSAAGYKLVELQPASMRADEEGKVVVQGKVLLPDQEQIFGLINHGDFGYERCKADPSVQMPTFRVTCPVNGADELAYFQLMTSTKTSVMAQTVLQQLAWPKQKLAGVYRSPATRRALHKARLATKQQQPQGQVGQRAGMAPSGDAVEEVPGEETSEEAPTETDANEPPVEPLPVVESS